MANIVVLNKALHGVGNGWDYRSGSPKSIIVHTTNGARFSQYSSEANYIYTTKKISAHFLVGKEGQITQFLDPLTQRAWHAGAVNDPRFNNNYSIGIEVHYTPGEGAWTKAMHDALTWLVQDLCKKYKIALPELVDTHRKVAVPKGRKIDPSGFGDAEFYVWRARLFEVPKTLPYIKYRVIVPSARIRTSPQINATNIVGSVTRDDIFESEATKIDENLEYVYGINTWAHITRGTHNGIRIDGLGFVHTSNLTIIG